MGGETEGDREAAEEIVNRAVRMWFPDGPILF